LPVRCASLVGLSITASTGFDESASSTLKRSFDGIIRPGFGDTGPGIASVGCVSIVFSTISADSAEAVSTGVSSVRGDSSSSLIVGL
jgi:hypothetical protein